MASSDAAAAARSFDWTRLAWPLMGTGVALGVAAICATRIAEAESPIGLVLLTVGLLSAGVAVTIRLNVSGPAFVNQIEGRARNGLLCMLACLFAAMAIGACTVVILTFYDLPWLPWHTGNALVLAVVVIPLGLATAYGAFGLMKTGRTLTTPEESALFLVLTSLCCFIGCWALYVPGDPGSWSTMRLALAVFTLVALIAAPLALASPRVRRWTISTIILAHFGAIVTTTLAVSPAPWLAGQLWGRVYRPYLEFMYLNNAYHFYAPEPNQSSYLWFRLIYADHEGTEFGLWFKVPDVDDEGNQHHTVTLEYQRQLAFTENVAPADPTPADFEQRFHKRARHVPQDPGQRPVGQEAPGFLVPFHPLLSPTNQYSMPNSESRSLLQSYAAHVARIKSEPPPELAGYTLKYLRIYRVVHSIVPMPAYARTDPPVPANDPTFYRPLYMGKFDPSGRLLDADDPLLYWLLPILRANLDDYNSPISDFARKHAGDPKWVFLPESQRWVEPAEAMINAPMAVERGLIAPARK